MINNSPWLKNPILFRSIIRDNYNNFVGKLFDYRSLIEVPNIFGESLLHYVCFMGMIDKYEALIQFGVEPKKTQLGNNLLHYCSISGYDDYLVMELVKSGISPIDENLNKETSIHFSSTETSCHYFSVWARNNNVNIVKLRDKNNNTVAHTSAKLGNKRALKFWILNFPELKSIRNNQNQLPEDIKNQDKHRFCTLQEL